MKAVVCVEHGPPERLQVQDIAVPEPGPGQVRVRVCAAGVNFPDTLIKGASIVGVFWGAFTQVEPSLHAANMAELMGWFRAGQLKPHVSNRFALDDGPAAIRWMMDRKAMGKVILTIADC